MPSSPPPGSTTGLLAPTNPVRALNIQHWRWSGFDSNTAPGSPAQGLTVYRPIASPRRLTPGRAMQARVLPPANTPGTIIQGLHVVSPRRLTPGRASTPHALPPSATPGTEIRGLQIVGQHPWRAGQAKQARALPPANTPGIVIQGLHVSSPRRLTPGRANQAHSLPPTSTPGTEIRGLQVVGQHPWRSGRATIGHNLGPPLPATETILRPIQEASPRRPAPGRIWLPTRTVPAVAPPVGLPFSVLCPVSSPRPTGRAGRVTTATRVPPVIPIDRFFALPIVRRTGDDQPRRPAGWLLRWETPPYLATLGYNIYSNGGSGPINYTTPIATVYGLTWTSGPLAFPDTWMFGVRAFDSGGEEKNLDCAIKLILDGSGNDVTQRPQPPVAMRAFATAGGGIRVEWSYNCINPVPAPTGFHVYIGTSTGGVLQPTAPISSAGQRGKWKPGSVHWQSAIGSGMDYATPVATVSFQSAIAGSFVANLTGLQNGMTYTIGVRAYNAVAEEPNTTTVSVMADATGPAAVVSLMATAV